MILDTYPSEDDIVGNEVGPFSTLRRQLWEIGVMVLPDPILGFRRPEDERKSHELIERFQKRYSNTLRSHVTS